MVAASVEMNLGRDFSLHSFLYLLSLKPSHNTTSFYHKLIVLTIKLKSASFERKLSWLLWFVFPYLNY